MTKEEKAWCDDITEIGCIACIVGHAVYGTPGAVHHLLTQGGRRMGHLFTVCLCDPGHHQKPQPGSGKVARHPTKARFEAAYGTEEELLAMSRRLVARKHELVAMR